MNSKRTLLSWSSGKDSAYALHLLKKDPNIELLGLFTTVNQKFKRVAMHGVRVQLLQAQAESMGLPMHIINIPYPCSNKEYEWIMGDFVTQLQKDKIDALAFGDLYLEDIRNYRIKQMANTGIDTLFPCWGIPTNELSNTIIDIGIKAKIACLDPMQIDAKFSGWDYDYDLLDALPAHIDPCGENGEFHTLVYNSPDFSKAIKINQGETIERNGFVFTDWW
ncbi:Dph6-related ATP pyrophosphatase [Bathymodiolus septemdierum thioautotrophic gill symbiont]|uniref:Diphthamide synthase domain-containing protein n=1 Tax=endosymbiont of Bathymodiolus septemdierum str. Myojin knoll TaxID=1303921 RepID=A0A0N7KBE1_9GAMM|nr:ATP-binding protein [Bathymodiolus septemdierum thioautotrophic gill symbiont]BAS67759.1 conserved hypothetical protein [endosymbiont of Bathymodiolus septemdierum str. Myojin knoll]